MQVYVCTTCLVGWMETSTKDHREDLKTHVHIYLNEYVCGNHIQNPLLVLLIFNPKRYKGTLANIIYLFTSYLFVDCTVGDLRYHDEFVWTGNMKSYFILKMVLWFILVCAR